MWYVKPNGAMYMGDMQAGDRAATEQEIADRDVSRDAEIKKRLLAEAGARRDTLLFHLDRLYRRAGEANDTDKQTAISTAQVALENMLNDPRVVSSIDGAAKAAVQTVYLEIFVALHAASPTAYAALKALDPL